MFVSETILSSPSYTPCKQSGGYNDRLDCTWSIYTRGNSKVQLTFTDFYTESGYDFVTIYDYVNYNWMHKTCYSGQKSSFQIISSSDRLRLKFTSDGSVQKRGFQAFINFSKYLCSLYLLAFLSNIAKLWST